MLITDGSSDSDGQALKDSEECSPQLLQSMHLKQATQDL